MRTGFIFVVAVGFSLLGILMSCEEALPTYQDPNSVLKGSVRGRYVLSNTANVVRFDFLVVNTFDETFQDKGILKGEIVITLRRNPSVHKTMSLGPWDLVIGKYEPSTQMLTMDPGDTVRLTVSWDYTDDQLKDLRDSLFIYVTDPGCSVRKIALEELFELEGSLTVFQRAGSITAGPVEFGLCHVDRWVPPQICTSILPEEACDVLNR